MGYDRKEKSMLKNRYLLKVAIVKTTNTLVDISAAMLVSPATFKIAART